MNALELMALEQLQRKLNDTLDIKPLEPEALAQCEQAIHKIKQGLHQALDIVIAIKENNDPSYQK